MKKIFAMLLTLCLLCGTVALADTYTNNSNTSPATELKVTVSSGYTVVIPATLDIPFNQTSTNLTVEVTALHLPSKYNALKVEVGKMQPLENENGKLIGYTIDDVNSRATRYFTMPESQNFVVGITQEDWNKAAAGNYTTTVSFNLSFETIETN